MTEMSVMDVERVGRDRSTKHWYHVVVPDLYHRLFSWNESKRNPVKKKETHVFTGHCLPWAHLSHSPTDSGHLPVARRMEDFRRFYVFHRLAGTGYWSTATVRDSHPCHDWCWKKKILACFRLWRSVQLATSGVQSQICGMGIQNDTLSHWPPTSHAFSVRLISITAFIGRVSCTLGVLFRNRVLVVLSLHMRQRLLNTDFVWLKLHTISVSQFFFF